MPVVVTEAVRLLAAGNEFLSADRRRSNLKGLKTQCGRGKCCGETKGAGAAMECRVALTTGFVTAISGPSGCGKSTLALAVAERLEGAATLHFDEFADDPPDIEEWGNLPVVDFGRWKAPEFTAAVERLKGGQPVTPLSVAESVATGRKLLAVDPHRFIVLEEPFGRLRPEIGQLVDFVVCIDLPLHLALARRLNRNITTMQRYAANSADAEGRTLVLDRGTKHLETYLASYLHWGHHFYAEQLRQVRETADMVVDGRLRISELADEVAVAVNNAAPAF